MPTKGFTLIETIVTIVILSMLVIVAGPPVIKYIEKRQITSSTEDLKTALELTQNRSITVVNQTAHGILLEPDNNRYAYISQNNDNTITIDRQFPLPSKVQITTPNNNTQIIFAKRAGTLEEEHQIILESNNFQSILSINQVGIVNITPPTAK